MVIVSKRKSYPKNRKPRPYKIFSCELCFGSFRSRYNGIRHYCDSCKVVAQRIRAAEWWNKNKEKYKSIRREINLQRRYGISVNKYNKLYRKQKGRCVICKQKYLNGSCGGLVVDHSHKNEKVRGLLCKSCNLTLGRLESNWDGFIDYLKRNK